MQKWSPVKTDKFLFLNEYSFFILHASLDARPDDRWRAGHR
ncbi:hypothetical protein GGU45_001871 [Niabella hirudinis]